MNGQPIDKEMLKAALEEMLRERNPELKGFLEELLLKFLTATSMTDHIRPLDMALIREKYALRQEAFVPLNALFQDAPPDSFDINNLHSCNLHSSIH